MIHFAVKNFEKFQHYKERSPVWIKLYSSVLEDYEFAKLPDASKAHLLAIWLLASRYSNRVPYDAQWISTRINATCAVDLAILERAGFILKLNAELDASKSLAQTDERASLETETETDTLTANAVKGGDAAASAPVNLKSQVFGPCLTWLAQATARTPKALRPHVGRWCKDYGDASVIECILEAQREAPVDPEAWIIGALRKRKGKHGNGTAKHRDASSADAKSERRTDIVEGLGLDVSGHGGAGVGGTEGDATGCDSGLPLAPSPGGDRGFGRAA